MTANLLLSDTRYMSFHEELKSLLVDSLFNTQPEDASTREVLYFQINALRDLMGIMQSYVDAARAIQEKQENID